MSKKPNKDTEREEAKKIYLEYANKMQKMIEDRDAKCESAKTQLIEMLKITADKYRTATGVMEALRVIRMVNDGRSDDMSIYEELIQARDLAAEMVIEVSKLVEKAENLNYAEMDKLCEDTYNKYFVSDYPSDTDLEKELMRLDLCRNVGPAAEDMFEFFKRTNEEINAIEDKTYEILDKYPDFLKLGPED